MYSCNQLQLPKQHMSPHGALIDVGKFWRLFQPHITLKHTIPFLFVSTIFSYRNATTQLNDVSRLMGVSLSTTISLLYLHGHWCLSCNRCITWDDISSKYYVKLYMCKHYINVVHAWCLCNHIHHVYVSMFCRALLHTSLELSILPHFAALSMLLWHVLAMLPHLHQMTFSQTLHDIVYASTFCRARHSIKHFTTLAMLPHFAAHDILPNTSRVLSLLPYLQFANTTCVLSMLLRFAVCKQGTLSDDIDLRHLSTVLLACQIFHLSHACLPAHLQWESHKLIYRSMS